MSTDRTRIRAADVDLASLILARNDAHPDGDWWFDPETGTTLYYGVDDDQDLPALREGVHVMVPHDPQPRSDVDDFFASAHELGVDDDAAAELYALYRGKGGLRRFRTRVAATAAAEAWSTFTLEREGARALSWLRSRGILADDDRARTMTDDDPPSEPTGMVPRVDSRLADFLGGDPRLPIALLLVVAGPARGQVLAVDRLPAVIGRSSDADLTLVDDTVSRRHAELRGDRTNLEIEDRGSSNGTTLNGNDIVGPIGLHDGDLVGLGSATLLVKRVS